MDDRGQKLRAAAQVKRARPTIARPGGFAVTKKEAAEAASSSFVVRDQ
jgi:hypothetical protein